VPLPCSAFHLSILSEVWLLNFLRICKSSTNGLCSLLNYQKVVSIYPPNHYSYHVKQQIINNHPTLGLTDFFRTIQCVDLLSQTPYMDTFWCFSIPSKPYCGVL
jgi:hypothetical protein